MNGPAPAIAVTGTGLVTALGSDAAATFAAILACRGGIGPMRALEQRPPEEKGGGQAADIPEAYRPDLDRAARHLRYTTERALQDADASGAYRPERCGAVFGTTLHGMRAAGRFLREDNPAALRDFLAGAVLRDALAGLGLLGAQLTTCAACASGLSAVALAATLLRAGHLDLVVAGGYDTVSEYAYAGFDSLRLVAAGAVRPFCKAREGMKVAEGFGVLVLERADEARRRGGRVRAFVAGLGESSDAYHLTQPQPAGEGAARAVRSALEDAKLAPCEIGLIAAHATATPNNDASEHAALRAVFGEALPAVPVSPLKSHLGHTLGGAGAVELILAAEAMQRGLVPPTANVAPEDVEFPGLDVSRPRALAKDLPSTLNLSLGFGGSNACVVLTRSEPLMGPAPPAREVAITGVGVVLPDAVGNDAFAARFRSGASPAGLELGPIHDSEYAHLLNARRVRRMSEYVKLTLAATAAACADARIADPAAFAESCSAILGTTHGSTGYCERYYGQIVREGLSAANPMLFAEGVPNAGAAQLSLMLGIKGGCQTIIGTRTAGLDALRLAALRIRQGLWDRAIVGAAEEYSSLINLVYQANGLEGAGHASGFRASAGAVTLILESSDAAAARGGRLRGIVEAGLSATPTAPAARGAVEAIAGVLRGVWQGGPALSLATGTWLDRAELLAARRVGLPADTLRPISDFAEGFSVGPLALLAGVLLTGSAPAGQRADRLTVLCTDFAGPIAAAGIRLLAGDHPAHPW